MKKHVFVLGLLFFGLNLSAQIINFTDVNFKNKLLAASTSTMIAKGLDAGLFVKIDVNNDGEIQVSEAQAISWLDIDNTAGGTNDIVNLSGIENFTNLEFLSLSYNSVTNLSLSNLNNLKRLFCDNNGMTSMNLSNLNALELLLCQYNNLPSINLSNFASLTELNCSSNSTLTSVSLTNLNNLKKLYTPYCQISNLTLSNLPLFEDITINNNILTNLDFSGFTNMKSIQCTNNQLTSLNVSGLSNLAFLSCGNNQLTQLDVSNMPYLESLICAGNQIVSLDVSHSTLLTLFYCFGNNLTQLYIKNGVDYAFQSTNGYPNYYSLRPNPNLTYVCADEAKISSLITYFNLPNIEINSYCSFDPGGILYTAQGNVLYDQNQNGCDDGDLPLPNVNLSILTGSNYSGYINSNASGHYALQVNSGTHTVSPQLENPNYFTVSPASYTVNFPTDSSPFSQNFCINKNGDHNDLEVTLIPFGIARPGFDAVYKIIYKNKGTASQSGILNFAFDDAVLDLISSNPAVSGQTLGHLNWNFTNLQPLESRAVLLTFNLNSPTETPPLNLGSVLNFNAIISGLTDEMPADNSFDLNQGVVNSFDPNDKTCLEGTTITPEMVGKEVHYLIRFENNGTANAQNIVVKDMIDTAKFDVNSLIPIEGSHPFATRITGTNKVEFIFENINLPFDDATNDGYIAFKIKTKPTLVLGNTFSNTASIYFDYNSPIITNNYTTAVALLAKQDFQFEDYFVLSPNPAKEQLHIANAKNIMVASVSIYNALGQLVMVIPNAQEINSVDVSGLKTGHYFIKIVSDLGTANSQFIKQ